ncbi:MAG: DUF2007 domain-containing protein [Nibricoccus sp.]
MRVVAAYSTPSEAHIARSRLESAGINAVVRDEFTVTFNWLYSNAVGGVKIEVIDEEEAAAREILGLPASEPGLILCPHCGSPDSSVRVLSVFGAICIFLKIPIPMTRAFVDCRSCKKTYDVPISGKSRSS